MATERIQIVVSSKGTVTVKREIEGIGKAAKDSNNGVDLLKKGLGLLAGVLSIGALVSFSDAGTRVANSLKVAGLEGEKFALAQDRLYKTAIKNGQSAEALASVYQKTSLVQKELGITSGEVIGAVEGIAAAMKLSTAGTSAQAGALQQLSQLLGGSIVQAQEYNSLIDGAFPLVQAAARGIEGMGGSVAKLTQAIKDGGFSSRIFFEGMMKGLQDTQTLAASLPLTIGQSIVSLQQAFTQWMNNAASVNHVMVALAAAILFVANNIDLMVYAFTPAVALLIYMAGQTVIGALITAYTSLATTISTILIPAVARLTALLWANPYALMAAAIIAVVAAIVYFRKELGITDALLSRIWKTGVGAWNGIKAAAMSAADYLAKTFAPLVQSLSDLWQQFYEVLNSAVFPVLKAIWKFVQPALAKWGEGIIFLIDLFIKMQTLLQGAFFTGVKFVFENILKLVTGVVDAVNYLMTQFSKAIALAKSLASLGGAPSPGKDAGPAKAPGFREGGQFTVGGTGGGTDKTPVNFNANRGERVTVETRKQQRQADNGNGKAGDTKVNVPVAITNVFDPDMIPAGIASASGQRAIMNIIKMNRDEINSALGVN